MQAHLIKRLPWAVFFTTGAFRGDRVMLFNHLSVFPAVEYMVWKRSLGSRFSAFPLQPSAQIDALQ